MADARHDFLQTINRRLDDLDIADVHRLFQQHVDEGRALLQEEGITTERIEALFQADMAYDGQIHEVRTPLPSSTPSRAALAAAFEASYQAQYGDTLGNRPMKVTTLRTTVIGVRPKTPLTPRLADTSRRLEEARQGWRSVYIDQTFVECPVYRRDYLPRHATFTGPAIVEQADTTSYITAGILVQVDAHGNLILQEG
jgi:N-methylhydantoinase A